MSRYGLFVVISATAVAMAIVYAPQPLLPVLAEALGVPRTQAASLITWSLLPMGLAPLGAGLLLQRVTPPRVMAGCLLALGLTEVAFAASTSFVVLAGLRLVQGTLVALLLPAVMTYVSYEAERLHRVMALYVTASVLGGLAGRLLAGFIAEVGAWWISFAVLAGLALATGGAALRLRSSALISTGERVRFDRLLAVLRRPSIRRLYAVVFCAFFVFTAVLNFMPFRLDALDAALGEGRIALSYSGFVFGMAASLFSERIMDALGSPVRAIAAGVGLLVVSLALLAVPAVVPVMASVGASAAGFFLTHAVLSAQINEQPGGEAGAVNSMYVACYYVGGTLGSLVPGFVYDALGWTFFVAFLLTVLGGAALFLARAHAAQVSVLDAHS